jgi:hypothetical protein
MGKNWTIATARQRLPALIASAAREPQRVYRRNTLVAVVASPEAAGRIGRVNLAARFDELRQICEETDYELPVPGRRDRANPFSRKRRR